MPTAAAIAAALDAWRRVEVPALPGRRNHLPAGVLVPLRFAAGRVEAVLTLRSARLRQHAGEVAWPGGKPEPGDADLWATATREAREEIGLAGARLLGRLSTMPLYTSDFRLHPFVAEVEGPLQPDGGEVVRLLPVDLLALLEAPHVEALPFDWHGQRWLSPVWELEPGLLLYGGTAHTLLELLEVVAPLYGRAVPPRLDTGRRWEQVLGRG